MIQTCKILRQTKIEHSPVEINDLHLLLVQVPARLSSSINQRQIPHTVATLIFEVQAEVWIETAESDFEDFRSRNGCVSAGIALENESMSHATASFSYLWAVTFAYSVSRCTHSFR